MTAVHVKKQSDADRLRRNLEGQGSKPRKAKTETESMLDAFTRECGTVEDWDGDRQAWRAALAAFTLGWNAHAKRRKSK